ncbi:MAG: hypothetical protein J5818_06690, partial [Eggerthellaceae bacterium]|nr:hypothetical protein [Eggerthellaceae bacterium]
MATRRTTNRTGERRQIERSQRRASQRPSQRDGSRDVAQRPAQPRRSAEQQQRRALQRKLSGWRRIGVLGTMVVMGLGCIIGLLFFLRPTVSEFENRTLTTYPDFAVASFLDGTYTSQVSLWYADTYPIREPLVRMNFATKSLFGIQPETQLIGGNRTSDELPPEGERTTEPQREHSHDVDAPEVRIRAAEIEDQIVDGLYVDAKAGSAYTLYYFDQGATEAYADVINDAANELEGKADVYSVLLPTNAGVMLDDETLAKLGVPNQKQAIDYFYSLMNDNVYTVDSFDVLYDHRDEYLYFHTDHHWTQLAAYYVYTAFCQTKGIEPAPYDEWEELVFEPFNGEYDGFVDIELTPDYVVARIPQGTNDMEYWVDDEDPSSLMEGNVISDLCDADPDANKYNCFVCGN